MNTLRYEGETTACRVLYERLEEAIELIDYHHFGR